MKLQLRSNLKKVNSTLFRFQYSNLFLLILDETTIKLIISNKARQTKFPLIYLFQLNVFIIIFEKYSI
jgi:hypothetical protein